MTATSGRALTEEQTTLRRQFLDFLDHDIFRDKYDRRIRALMDAGGNRLLLDMSDLLDYFPDAAGSPSLGLMLVREPGRLVPLLEIAVHDLVLQRQPDYLKVDYRSRTIHVGFEGPIGEVLGPRQLYARHLNTLVAVEGIVTRQSPLRPRVLESVHYCAETNKFTRKEYRDQLSPMLDETHLPTINVMPKTDLEGHVLRTELGLCQFVDSQCAVLQEAPERAPTGQLPRSVEMRLDDDLVDAIKPGDRVVVVGIYSPYTASGEGSGGKSGFQTILLVNHIFHAQLASKVPRLTESVTSELQRFAAHQLSVGGPSRLIETLGRAIAPSIYGLQHEKQAVLLMLVGGVERHAHTTHIRGDINLLLVGEPSTAKSQLLRYVINLAPLALSTTGKGSSGVGLTAAVTSDPYTGERSLSAGAMVLADRGILCVDEFDKMNSQDRVAMHEAMEQQTVTVAKAGIHATLNARCSVLAAANPVYGIYSVKHKLSFNVGLPESLLSRFDLIFIILDKHTSEHNRRIGAHILQNHMTAQPAPFGKVDVKTVVGRDDDSAGASGGPSSGGAENQQPSLGGAPTSSSSSNATVVSVDFLRRYIHLAKTKSPKLNESSQRLISQHYVQLRAEQNGPASSSAGGGTAGKDGFLITARTLEAMVRLATAHAKLRLADVIEEGDVEVAIRLLRESVHAATDAASLRGDAEKRPRPADDGSTAEPSSAAAAAAVGTALGSASAMGPPPVRRSFPAAGGRSSTEVPLTAPPLTMTSESRRVIMEAVRQLQREHRAEATVTDVAQRLSTLGTLPGVLARGGPGASATSVVETVLRDVAASDDDAPFTVGENGTLYFM